jgi:tetratricopeptide (TPR) repeat protein
MKLLLPIIIFLAIIVRNAAAADESADFNAANNLYAQGKYAAAAAAYENILAGGQASGALYFNLGNAHFKAGQPGRAIAAYRQAEQINPRDPDVQANLQFARNQVGNVSSVKRGIVQQALSRLTLNEWTTLTGAATSLWFILLALGEFRPAWRAALRGYVLLTGLAAAMLLAGTWADWRINASVKSTVVITPETAVRIGPLDDAQTSFTAKDGAELTVLDEREDWLQVQNGARQTGWVKRAAVRIL